MRNARLDVIAMIALAAAAGCGSTAEHERAVACDELQTSASEMVGKAFDDNRACQVASDCVELAFQASCFDSCSRAVAKTGMAAVQAAIDAVEAQQCAQANNNGCRVEVPPCVPPAQVTCTGGLCQ